MSTESDNKWQRLSKVDSYEASRELTSYEQSILRVISTIDSKIQHFPSDNNPDGSMAYTFTRLKLAAHNTYFSSQPRMQIHFDHSNYGKKVAELKKGLLSGRFDIDEDSDHAKPGYLSVSLNIDQGELPYGKFLIPRDLEKLENANPGTVASLVAGWATTYEVLEQYKHTDSVGTDLDLSGVDEDMRIHIAMIKAYPQAIFNIQEYSKFHQLLQSQIDLMGNTN